MKPGLMLRMHNELLRSGEKLSYPGFVTAEVRSECFRYESHRYQVVTVGDRIVAIVNLTLDAYYFPEGGK